MLKSNQFAFPRLKRRANTPTKLNPIHFNHGERIVKNCLLCEGKQKQNPKKYIEGGSNQQLKETKNEE